MALGERQQLILDCAELGVRGINAALRELPDGGEALLANPEGRHNIAVGLWRRLRLTVAGNAGYYVGGLGDGPELTVEGAVGWGAGENLMSGTVRILGNASQSAAASAHGGLVAVHGNASLRAGISLKGGTLAVAGDVGAYCGFMAQAGTILVGGNAGEALGDSLYEAVIYVAGAIRSLGTDTRIEELTDTDLTTIEELNTRTGFDHIRPAEVTKVVSARQLYHFSTHHSASY
jgi:glutamate synthase domain-containing protein 3